MKQTLKKLWCEVMENILNSLLLVQFYTRYCFDLTKPRKDLVMTTCNVSQKHIYKMLFKTKPSIKNKKKIAQ